MTFVSALRLIHEQREEDNEWLSCNIYTKSIVMGTARETKEEAGGNTKPNLLGETLLDHITMNCCHGILLKIFQCSRLQRCVRCLRITLGDGDRKTNKFDNAILIFLCCNLSTIEKSHHKPDDHLRLLQI